MASFTFAGIDFEDFLKRLFSSGYDLECFLKLAEKTYHKTDLTVEKKGMKELVRRKRVKY